MSVSPRRSIHLLPALTVLFLLSSLLIILSGCEKKMVCSTVPTFFPPPPDEPRIQYLTGITSITDIGDTKKEQSTFSLVLTGQQEADIIRKIGKSFGLVVYNSKLYIAESGFGRVVIVDPVKGTIEYPKGMQSPHGALKSPVSLALDGEGYLYVADTGRNEIVVYDPAGNFLTSFGKDFGKIFGFNPRIVGVAVFGGKLYVLDMGTQRIRVLDRKTGEETTEPFGYIEKPNQSLRKPGNFAMDAQGNFYVTNIGNNMVMKYDIDGNFIGSFGGSGDQISMFVKPKGIALDDANRIYVVDGGTNIVQLFDDQFRLLTLFGWPGLETGSLNMPAGITVTSDKNLLQYFKKYAVKGFELENLIFVVNQYGQEFCIPRISVYGLGQMQDKKAATPDAQEKKSGQ
jgi:DNA-binding beta-propeller fold protein YncE